MELLYKISEQLKSKNKTQKQLCEFLGLSRQTFSEWNAGRSNSYMKYLPQIAEFLDVSVDYLVGNNNKNSNCSYPIVSINSDVSEIEKEELLLICDSLSKTDFSQLLEYSKFLKAKNNSFDKPIVMQYVDSDNAKIDIATDKILFIEAQNHITLIHTIENQTFQINRNLNYLSEILPTNFIRCHLSFIVNLNYITQYSKLMITLSDGTEIPVRSSVSSQLKKQIEEVI